MCRGTPAEERMNVFFLDVEESFASAHQLRGYKGKCENLHGHNWKVCVTVCGAELDHLGMLMDFGDLKAILRDELGKLDHCFLNETPPFDTINPTSENLAKVIFERISARLPQHAAVHAVRVWESDRCSATYQKQ